MRQIKFLNSLIEQPIAKTSLVVLYVKKGSNRAVLLENIIKILKLRGMKDFVNSTNSK